MPARRALGNTAPFGILLRPFALQQARAQQAHPACNNVSVRLGPRTPPEQVKRIMAKAEQRHPLTEAELATVDAFLQKVRG